MDYRLIWSPEAVDDIEAIGKYIARDSNHYAASVVQKIFETPQSLLNFPEQGRIVPELGDESIREIFVFQYRIIYKLMNYNICILTVIHGKRELSKDSL